MEVFKHITDNGALIWTEIDVIPDCLKYVFSVTLTSIFEVNFFRDSCKMNNDKNMKPPKGPIQNNCWFVLYIEDFNVYNKQLYNTARKILGVAEIYEIVYTQVFS